MRADLGIILDPSWELGKDRFCVGQDGEAGTVSFERFDEALRHAIALGAPHRCEEQRQSQGSGGVGCFFGDVGAAVI